VLDPHSVLDSIDAMHTLQRLTAQGFSITRSSLTADANWKVHEGAISHGSRGFFDIVGVRFGDNGQTHSEGIFLRQPQSAFNGLLLAAFKGEDHFLVQARIEPGNLGIVQYGPTIQSTPSNYLRLHGGRKTAYLDFFLAHHRKARPLHDSYQLDLGERYLQKNKRLSYVQALETPAVEAPFAWLPAAWLPDAVTQDATLNTDLRSMIGVMPWSRWSREAPRGPLGRAWRTGLASPVRHEVIGAILAHFADEALSATFCPLSELGNWQISEHGLHESTLIQGFSVEMYAVTAPGREVEQWSQPLINSHNEGRQVLLCRKRAGSLEVLLQVRPERGLSTRCALAPSFLRYPGQPAGEAEEHFFALVEDDNPQVLIETRESDEGGRFFNDVSKLSLILVDGGSSYLDAWPDSYWVSISEFKLLLKRSNLCAIQLRCMASFLLGLDRCD